MVDVVGRREAETERLPAMSTVAVMGAGGSLGRAVLAHLDADDRVERIIGLDVVPPPMPVAKLDFRTVDIRDRLLGQALAGADVVVHCLATSHLPDAPARGLLRTADEDTLFAVTVGGTRNLLDAAATVGVDKLVHVSSTSVYGAHPDNAVPLDESEPLRANPDFPFAYHRLLAEELVAKWDGDHPEVSVSILRAAPMLGPAADDVVARMLEAPRPLQVRGYAPPYQFVHVDDVAAAVALGVRTDLAGTFNVAADGWLSTGDMWAMLGRKPVTVPETVAFSVLRQLHARGLMPVPAGALHYLMHPVVVATEGLHAHGWGPIRSNREVLREFVGTNRGFLTLGRLRLRRRDVYVAAAAGLGMLAGLLLGWRAYRRSR